MSPTTTTPEAPPLLMTPRACAERLGITTDVLLRIMRVHRYDFTELAPGGKPGDRGPNRWGMTPAQLAAVVAGQARQWAPEPPEEAKARVEAIAGPASTDGVSRLRRRKKR